MNCPDCGEKLYGKGSSYRCMACDTKWEVEFSCEICGEEPENVGCCGTVSFFCKKCKSLKSRESMNRKFSRAD